MILIIVGALMLVGLVIMHELGHFFAARRAGVEVEEFGIGFPPRAKTIGFRKGTRYTLNWLPLGGFVKLKGEHDSDTAKGTFGAASLKDKVKIMLAGIVVNALVAVLLLSVVAAFRLPKVLDNQFTVASDTKIVRHDVVAAYVVEDSPAEAAGIRAGDRLLQLQPTNCDRYCRVDVTSSDDIRENTSKLAGRDVAVSYINEQDEVVTETVTFLSEDAVESSKQAYDACQETETGECPPLQSYLGIVPSDYVERRSTWSAPIVATVVSGQVTQETFSNLGSIFAGLFRGETDQAKSQVTGVVGIGYVLGEMSSRGFVSVLFLTAIISLSLAIMNLLPIPALDGGRLFVTLLFRVLRKPLTKETEEKIHGSGFLLLMGLFVLITIVDVQRFIINT